MNRYGKMMAVLILVAVTGCATHVAITPTHRENMAAQSKVLAITARNLEGSLDRHHADAAAETAAQAVVDFHTQAENFAGTTAQWLSEDKVNSDYELLIKAWVKLKKTFPDLKSDNLAENAYKRVQSEWEKLARSSGYSGRKYQEQIEQGK
jgi:hypothetical protein